MRERLDALLAGEGGDERGRGRARAAWSANPATCRRRASRSGRARRRRRAAGRAPAQRMFTTVDHVVALHGFAGSGRSWDRAAEALGGEWLVHAPDLPASLEDCVAAAQDGAPERFVLAGYSMGGRVALHEALAVPQRIERLVLVSTTSGIEDPPEREPRRAADEELATRSEAGTIGASADGSLAQPRFADDPPEVVARWRE